MICSNCGHDNSHEANFCSSCGHRLAGSNDDATITFTALDLGDPQAEEELASAVHELPSNEATLFVRRGTNAGATYLLDKDVVLAGRNPTSEIFLDDVTVSRKHAEFHRANGVFRLQDLGSLNGTYVNGESVDAVELSKGDEVQIGKFKLIFLTGAEG
jgi:hypothetical protein